ncbi:MAG: TrkH family potassium uptake protein [Lachnospiraceae bacterium]|nr:TrkH family potassium uptake protein [Lachnospiraceae bacterium]
MDIIAILEFVSNILAVEALLMLPSVGISAYCGEFSSVKAFLVTIVLLTLTSLLLRIKGKGTRVIHAKEGFAIVAISWIAMSIFGALPFYISGSIPSFIDCVFETVSGFTTTGASILTNIESLPRGILYWRAFTHWIGGMGVLVFILAVLPVSKSTVGSLYILQSESPGPTVGKLVPSMKSSASILYRIYMFLTLMEILFLLLGGMPLFDSITNAMATAGTGGFCIKNSSIAAYDSFYLQGVISVFMVLFGINFNIFYFILIKQFKRAYKNEELKIYLGIIAIATILIGFNVRSLFDTPFEAFHHSFFQVASVMTTTGFATTNFDLWPEFSRIIIIGLMIIGASAGSTGGGIKVARLVLLAKAAKNGVQKHQHPNSVRVIKMDDKIVSDQVISSVFVFMFVYCTIVFISILIVALNNFDFETTVTSVLTCINNVGPGFGMVSPIGNFHEFSVLSKIVLIANMLIGRLEIFPMLMIFMPSYWKRGK